MMRTNSSVTAALPGELLSLICAYVYAAGEYPHTTSLDPLLHSVNDPPVALPSSFPPAYWSVYDSRRTLNTLCLVSRPWHEAARPWLWRKVEVHLPRSWLSLVEEIAGGDLEEAVHEGTALNLTIQEVEAAMLARQDASDGLVDQTAALRLHVKVVEQLTGPDGSIPPELLTPAASRDPSPRRLRAKSRSPVRWKLMRSISDAVRSVFENEQPGIYVPSPEVSHVGHFIHHLDFNHFRTIGMRRSIEEGVNNRFVTGSRLESILKEMPNLLAFGATEYMDSALTFPVLKELLLRGSASRGRGRPSRGRDLVVFDPFDAEEEDRERRRECKELEAIDLTGCVSAVFVSSLTQFVTDHLIDHSDTESNPGNAQGVNELARWRTQDAVHEPLMFPGTQRLGLRGVKSILPHILHPFVLAFSSLTHLDLSCTRVSPELLAALGTSPTVRLRSLALERCNWLTGESIRSFMVDAPAARDIEQLSLYGDLTYPSPLGEDELHDILAHAPCFVNGRLVYLDLSSAPLTRSMLLDTCAPQPRLRSLGLSHMHELDLGAVREFLRAKAPNVEILTLVSTSPQLGYGAQAIPVRQASITLHSQLVGPLCTAPFYSGQLFRKKSTEVPTRLRVIELAMPLLAGLAPGANSWRVIKSKGGRGWYVDTAGGWIAEASSDETGNVLRRDLQQGHPWRSALEALADANGNVTSCIGWHARKMEVLHGDGLLGREAGLYGAVSFAYQG